MDTMPKSTHTHQRILFDPPPPHGIVIIVLQLVLILGLLSRGQSPIMALAFSYPSSSVLVQQLVYSQRTNPITRFRASLPTKLQAASDNTNEEDMGGVVQNLQQEAERMRLEAQRMEWKLTLQKIDALETKIKSLKRSQKYDKIQTEIPSLQAQIEQLQTKLWNQSKNKNDDENDPDNRKGSRGKRPSTTATTIAAERSSSTTTTSLSSSSGTTTATTTTVSTSTTTPEIVVMSSPSASNNNNNGQAAAVMDILRNLQNTTLVASSSSSKVRSLKKPEKKVAGFKEYELQLYIPIAERIEQTMINATTDEKLEAFRQLPELQDHFRQKLALQLSPIQDLLSLENYKSQYLKSRSANEKQSLLRQIRRLEQSLQAVEDITISTNNRPLYRGNSIPTLTETELQTIVQELQELPALLQSLLKRKNQLKDSDGLRLAITLDHYRSQVDALLFEAYHFDKTEIRRSVEYLPTEVQQYVAKKLLSLEQSSSKEIADTTNDIELEDLVDLLSKNRLDSDDSTMDRKIQVVFEPSSSSKRRRKKRPAAARMLNRELPEYSDVEFMDRSRYIEDLYPSIARLEGLHPDMETVENILRALDRKTFMVTSKPERVLGGYYIRGVNQIEGDDSGTKLMDRLKRQLSDFDTVEFFYILDPSPIPEEEYDLSQSRSPVLLITGKNASVFYNHANIWTKLAVTVLGVATMSLFATGVCVLEPAVQEQLNAATSAEDVDLFWLTHSVLQILGSLIAIQVAHEVGHVFVGWRDKVRRC